MEWISVEERLPHGSQWCLVCAGGGAMNCMAYNDGQWEDWTNATCHNINPSHITHWMPLPEPPKE